MEELAFIGLGAMGRPIARNLVRAGYSVAVWNQSRGPVDEVVQAGARRVDKVSEALAAPLVISMLSDDDAVRSQLLSADAARALEPGSVHMNMSTISADLARTASEHFANHGVS